ncbi:MAG: hypothetical protein J5801_01460 [Bacteroidales bacterium]|nr:hypothetical protein [Bacteroidales bacterium]
MKSKDNIQKDWQELLREKAGNVAGAQPEVSFAELKEKMVAAGASAGSGRRGLSWLKYAAAVAVIGAAGAMLLINPDKSRDISSSTAENRKAEEVTVVSEPVLETEPVAEAALPIETVDPVDNNQDETIPVDLTKLTANDAASSNAPSGSLAQRSGKASGSLSQRSGESSDSTVKQQTSEVTHAESTKEQTASANNSAATETPVVASDATPSGNKPAEAAPATVSPKQDPFAEPVKPLKKQLRRFSVGASGFLASNGLGNGKISFKSMASDMVTYTDNNGKIFYSYSAPSVRYNHSAPISGGISFRYNFTPVLYAESGLRLTYLHTWISPSGAAQDLLYAGIPLGMGVNFAHLGNASFYASAYGMLSKCVMGHNSAGFPSNYSQLSDIPLMWSAGAALGASYNITRTFGLFAEPTVSYYFPASNAPQTIYKENPWYFTLNLGVRFNLK